MTVLERSGASGGSLGNIPTGQTGIYSAPGAKDLTGLVVAAYFSIPPGMGVGTVDAKLALQTPSSIQPKTENFIIGAAKSASPAELVAGGNFVFTFDVELNGFTSVHLTNTSGLTLTKVAVQITRRAKPVIVLEACAKCAKKV
jgi:hypothetical protein